MILAITVNIEGNGYGLVCPLNLSPEDVDNITNKISVIEPHIWSEKNYLSQNAKYLCDPKIWFVTDNPGDDGDNFGTTKPKDIDDTGKNISNVDNSDMMKPNDIDDKDNIIRFPKK